jgi:hypothetical protein
MILHENSPGRCPLGPSAEVSSVGTDSDAAAAIVSGGQFNAKQEVHSICRQYESVQAFSIGCGAFDDEQEPV